MQIKIDGYETRIINRNNYEEVWAVYESNPDYFMLHKQRAAKPSDILGTFERLVAAYDPANQYFVGFWRDDAPWAVLELLPNFPSLGELWLSEIIVHGDLQKSGLGRAIVQCVIDESAKFDKISLGTDLHLVKFWESFGFVQTDKSDGYVHFTRACASSTSIKMD